MPRYRSSVQVPVTPAEAFAFVSDFTHAAHWDPMVERAEKEPPGPVRVGTRFVLFSRVLGRTVELPYEVVEMEAGAPAGSAGPESPRRLVLEGRTLLFRYRDEIGFEPAGTEASTIHYDAALSFRGPLALANPALKPVLRRAGDDALAGIARLLRRPGGAGSVRPAPPPPGVSPREVAEIVALEDRPALRNLLITRGYHLLSRRLGDLLGTADANWCTYATWASKTAGFFIREEEVDAELRRWLQRKARLRKRLRAVHRALRDAHPEAGLYDDGDELGPVLEVSGEVGRWIRAGNRVVFEELGGLFAAWLEEYAPPDGAVDDARLADAGRLEAFLDRHLRPGQARPDRVERRGDELVSTPEGGQDLLRQAIRCYHRALRADDPKVRSELILLGNALGGLHEQTRLQTYIAGSLGAPVEEVLYSRRNDALVQRLGQAALGPVQEVFHRRFAPLGEEVARRVREFSTLHLMRMPIPGEVLELGEDLPAPRGGPLFPPALEVLQDGELVEVLTRYGVYPEAVPPGHPWLRLRARVTARLVRLGLHPPVVAGSAAEDWADLDQRMRYIFCYFRSRQASPDLFGPPFTPAQEAALLEGRIPAPPL